MATKLAFQPRQSAVVIVAHPDDETIWMGGFILKHPELDWTILCLCRASDPDRAPKFRRVCARYGARGIIEDQDDEGRLSYDESVAESKRLITKNLSGSQIDHLFTHGANGEYGHEGHIAVNEAVAKLVREGRLSPRRLLHFNYVKAGRKLYGPLKPRAGSDLVLELTARELSSKRAIMTELYGFSPDGIDTNYCTNPEAFKITSSEKTKSRQASRPKRQLHRKRGFALNA